MAAFASIRRPPVDGLSAVVQAGQAGSRTGQAQIIALEIFNIFRGYNFRLALLVVQDLRLDLAQNRSFFRDLSTFSFA
ncbi:MAG: hypothetical protein DRH37_08415 [Deltaproteobacteria bacterium]|nr:MAG: hypothetical protein DRH37_08415 [Deltaproteobacteria bacterium]